jgi:hypothetical protein
VIGEHLAPTALRVVATDERLTLMMHTDVIPAMVRAQFEHDHRVHHALDVRAAVAVLALIREKILEPFPEHDTQRPYTRSRVLRRRRPRQRPAGRADRADITEVEIHPDVVFGLGLVDAPAAKRGEVTDDG